MFESLTGGSKGKNAKLCAKMKDRKGGTAFSVVIEGQETFYEEKPLPKPKDIYDFAVSKMPQDTVEEIRRERDMLSKLFDGKNKRAVLLLTEKYDVSPMFLFFSFKHAKGKNLKFGISRASNLEIGRFMKVKKYPLVVMIEKVRASVSQSDIQRTRTLFLRHF